MIQPGSYRATLPWQRTTFLLFVFWALVCPLTLAAQQTYVVQSPDKRLSCIIEISPRLQWQISRNGVPITDRAPIAMQLGNTTVLGGAGLSVLSAETTDINAEYKPVAPHKHALLQDRCSELTLHFAGDWGIIVRVYNNGVAYRFFTKFAGSLVVMDETVAIRPLRCEHIYFPEEAGFYSHNECVYQKRTPAELRSDHLASLPVLWTLADGSRLLLTESDLQDYPGLWVQGTDGKTGALRGVFPRYPRFTVALTDRDIQPTDREPYLSQTIGTRRFPWRILIIAEKDADLLNNSMPYLLAEPSRLRETEWIKPGKAAWDWWNNLNLKGVNFSAGLNTNSYLYFIDFAAQYGLEYVVLDEGWSEVNILMNVNRNIDMDIVAAHARQKGVGLILWVSWKSIDQQFDMLLPRLKRWGIKGLKVDFMQRDDQEAVNFYWRMAKRAAENKLLLDFHGAHKPAGLQRTYPNVLTFEGVYGLEQSRRDAQKRIDPEHNVTIPFIRMAAGPMDYTPGAMRNRPKNDWAPSWQYPASIGTRCHELAKYIVYESPLQMLADSPTQYEQEPECMAFLSAVPVVWQRSLFPEARIGDYVVAVREAQNGIWYIGGMADNQARVLRIKGDFLPAGEYEMQVFEDGPNVDRNAEDFTLTRRILQAGDNIPIIMAAGGGFVGVLRPLRK